MESLERLFELEEGFLLNEEHGDFNKPSFEFRRGDLPIIFTAPHSVKTRMISKKTGEDVMKENENFTGAFSLYLNEVMGVHSMVRNNYPYNVYTDPRGDYLELIEYIKRFDIKYLVDLHGCKRKLPYDVAPGINHGVYIYNDARYKEAIEKAFGGAGIERVNFETKFQASAPRTIARNVFDEAQIRTTQLEINRNYRDKKLLENLKKMLIGLEDYTRRIDELIKEDFPKVFRP